MHGTHSPPVIVVGAGFVGCLAAILLHQSGRRVCVVDQGEACADAFRAEKLEPEQSDALREFGLWDVVASCLTPIGEVGQWRDGVVSTQRNERHFAMRYPDLVNALRRRVEELVGIEVQRVTSIASEEGRAVVQFANGDVMTGSVCLLATGSVTSVARAGLPVAIEEQVTSLNLGCDVQLIGEQRSVPLAFNYHSSHPHRDGLHYVTFFPMGQVVRVNAFTAWRADDARIRKFTEAPVATLHELLPRLRELYGAFDCVSKVRTARTRYHRVTGATAAVVAIGEACQSVSPATGMGLSRCLTDVRVLLRHFKQWPEGSSVSAQQVGAFYADPEKVRMDKDALHAWRWFCASVHDRSIKWRIKRSPVGAVLRWVQTLRQSREQVAS